MSAASEPSLDALPRAEPSWLYGNAPEAPLSHAESARFLGELGEEDFGIFVLAYGLGMRFGAISQTLRLDPALVVWRLRRALERWRRARDAETPSPRALEAGLRELLRAERPDAPPPPRDLPSWRAEELVRNLADATRERLAEHLEEPGRAAPARPGVGIGLAVVILLGAAALAVFGAVRDEPPLREGRRLMAEGRYAEARAAFLRLGDSIEGRKRRALCFVAEGQFERAFEIFDDVEVLASLGQFAPHELPLVPLEDPGGPRALLPRGTVLSARPRFVLPAPVGVELRVTAEQGGARSFRLTPSSTEPVSPDHPELRRAAPPGDWAPLGGGSYTWQVVGDPAAQARFEVVDPERRAAILDHLQKHLHYELAGAPARFLKAQLYLQQGLLMDAGMEFAGLTRAFPGAAYPARRLADVSAALGVDPSAFAR